MTRAAAIGALLLTAASFAAAELVIIGKGLGAPGGSTPWSACWGASARRHQVLVLKTDGLPAGTITKWEWNAANNLLAGSFYNFKLTFCHTSLTALTDTYVNNYDGKTPVTVLSRNPVSIPAIPADQWFGFEFDKSFDYNGRDNLVVEVWWVEDTNGGGNTQWNFPVPGRCCFSYIVNGNPQSGYPDKGYVSYFMHYMRATVSPAAVAPTSVGRVRALYR